VAQSGYVSRDLVNIPDPAQELARLEKLDMPGQVDMAKKEWLSALALVGDLRPEKTTTADPDKTYAELKQLWLSSAGAAAAQPKPLSWFDIPVQWVFTGIGFGGAAWMLILFLTVARQKYRWEPETMTLTLPDGRSIAPSDLEDVDKRKWDKYLVFLKLKPPHPLAGRELKLDLYRYKPLEDWVLAMESAAFPDRKQEPDAPAQAETAEPAGA
jgi:hypothetical protein